MAETAGRMLQYSKFQMEGGIGHRPLLVSEN